jgi:hypothetical protein
MDELPPYIVVGEWKDEEWLALSRTVNRGLTREELARVIAGPRRHPYGPEAYQVMMDGETVVYPSREAADV